MKLDHEWVPLSFGAIPPLAVEVGEDPNCDVTYVGRSHYGNEILPATILPLKEKAFLTFDTQVIQVETYEALNGKHYLWIPAANGEVLPTSVKVGRTANGEVLYAGRCFYEEGFNMGKIQPSQKCMYVPYGNREIKFTEYEVLTLPDRFIHTSADYMPDNAFKGGYDSDGDDVYVGLAIKDNAVMPAKVVPNKGGAFITYNGRAHKVESFQVLVGNLFMWVPYENGNIDSRAVSGGYDSDGETIYIGRAEYEGSLCVGKVYPAHGYLYVPYGGEEIGIDSFEILVRI